VCSSASCRVLQTRLVRDHRARVPLSLRRLHQPRERVELRLPLRFHRIRYLPPRNSVIWLCLRRPNTRSARQSRPLCDLAAHLVTDEPGGASLNPSVVNRRVGLSMNRAYLWWPMGSPWEPSGDGVKFVEAHELLGGRQRRRENFGDTRAVLDGVDAASPRPRCDPAIIVLHQPIAWSRSSPLPPWDTAYFKHLQGLLCKHRCKAVLALWTLCAHALLVST
jgi:hypothetical protein